MKYLIIGAGGTGGMIAAALHLKNFDTSVIARGNHLLAIKENGLHIKSKLLGDFTAKLKTFSQEEYTETPDVVFVCVKDYSLNEIIPFLKKICITETIIIPILNVFGTGEKIQKEIPNAIVLDGCIYIIAFKSNVGEISHPSDMFKIVFGKRDCQQLVDSELIQVERDLKSAGIQAYLSDKITSDTFAKVTLISPYAACGAYFDITVGEMQKEGEARNFLIGLLGELQKTADKMKLNLGFDVVERNLAIIDKMSPDTISSLYRDIKNNHQSEIDGQIFEIVRLGKKLGIEVPYYRKVAEKFGFKD